MTKSSHTRQVIASLLGAAAIVTITIIVVTAQFGPTSAAEQEAIEERQEERLELREERSEQREERREDEGR